MEKVEHIGIAVKELEKSIPLFEALLQTACYKKETVESEKVITAFFKQGDTKIELLQASDSQSVIHRFIEKKGEGIHHLAFAVDDIYKTIEDLKTKGFSFISDIPKKGADNKLVCFLHPATTNNILIEICQEMDESK